VIQLAFYLLFSALFASSNAPDPPFALQKSEKADHFLYRNWTIDDGLPVNAVSDILESDDGYRWITSYDGLIRFDGVTFDVYNTSNTSEIPSNRFLFSAKDSAGVLWFGLEISGLLKYENGQFTLYDGSNGFTDGNITQLFFRNDALLVTTLDGLYTYQDQTITRILKRNTPAGNQINHGFTADDGTVFLSTNDGLIELLPDNQWNVHKSDNPNLHSIQKTIPFNNTLWSHNSTDLFISDNKGSIMNEKPIPELEETYIYDMWANDSYLFISTSDGLIVSNTELEYQLIANNDFEMGRIKTYTEISDGPDYFTCTKGRLFSFHEGVFDRVNPDNKLDDIHFSKVTLDSKGQLWMSTNKNGLIQLLNPSVAVFGEMEGLPNDNVISLFEDKDGNIWTSSRMRGLTKITPEGELSFFTELSNGRNFFDVNALNQSPDGTIWIGINERGIAYFEDDSFHLISLGNEPNINEIRSIHINEDGSMLIGTLAGLVTFDGRDERSIARVSGLENAMIYSITEVESGKYWITTANNGVYFYDSSDITQFNTSDGLPLNAIRGIYIDRDEPETIWFSTEGRGISRFKNGEFSTINSSDGLFDDLIHTITEDNNGRLWMSTNRGIFYIYKKEANELIDGELNSILSVVFNRNNGMRNSEANGGAQNTFINRADGRLLYATQGGIAIINSEQINDDATLPIPHIASLQAGNEIFNNQSLIELESGTQDFTIQYTGFEYMNPERISFRYKLEGYDKDWIEAGSQRSASYTNLPPKKYRFLLTASNNHGQWNPEYASISINIKPFFYQQAWFWILISIFIVFGIYQIHKTRVRNLEKKEFELQKLVKFRTAELESEKEAVLAKQDVIEKQKSELLRMNQAKDKFLSIIAHDLKGPFGGVLGITKVLNDELNHLDKKQIQEFVKVLNDSSENIYKLLENLLGWANLQTNTIKPTFQDVDAESAIYKALKIFGPIAIDKGIDIITNCDRNTTVRADVNMLDTIIRNLISNAIKFSFPKGIIKINAFRRDEQVCFEVVDKGIGIPDHDLAKLFEIDTHFTSKGTSNEGGTGLGLILCKEMAETMNGTIEVISQSGHGSIFTFVLPAVVHSKTHQKNEKA